MAEISGVRWKWVAGFAGLAVLWLLFLSWRGPIRSNGSAPQPDAPAAATAAPPQPRNRDLSARVRFDGTRFTVFNDESDDWLDVRCTLNRSGVFREGYELHVKRLDAGQSFTVGAMQFAKSDGTRFNPFQMKPLSMSITVKIDTLSGPSGFYYAQW